MNKDLPSCWECPKCVQGITDPEVHNVLHTHTHTHTHLCTDFVVSANSCALSCTQSLTPWFTVSHTWLQCVKANGYCVSPFFLFFIVFFFRLHYFLFSFDLIKHRQSSGSDEPLAAGHQQHIRPHGPLVLRLGPGPSATIGGPVGTQQDGEVIRCGFFPPPLPSCSSSSSLLLVAAPLPSQPISSRLVRGAAYSEFIHPSVQCTLTHLSSHLFRRKDTTFDVHFPINDPLTENDFI